MVVAYDCARVDMISMTEACDIFSVQTEHLKRE